MPRFYFDIHDGADTIDQDGVLLSDRKLIEPYALRTLFDIARDDPSVLRGSSMTIAVRDDAGDTVYRATLDLRTSWIMPNKW